MNVNDMSKFDLSDIESQYSNVGFQATHLSRAISIIKEMKKQKATVFLTFTSNMVASGLRGIFTEMCKRKFVDCYGATAAPPHVSDLRACRRVFKAEEPHCYDGDRPIFTLET